MAFRIFWIFLWCVVFIWNLYWLLSPFLFITVVNRRRKTCYISYASTKTYQFQLSILHLLSTSIGKFRYLQGWLGNVLWHGGRYLQAAVRKLLDKHDRMEQIHRIHAKEGIHKRRWPTNTQIRSWYLDKFTVTLFRQFEHWFGIEAQMDRVPKRVWSYNGMHATRITRQSISLICCSWRKSFQSSGFTDICLLKNQVHIRAVHIK